MIMSLFKNMITSININNIHKKNCRFQYESRFQYEQFLLKYSAKKEYKQWQQTNKVPKLKKYFASAKIN